jgi:hypothetical protein
MRYIFIYKTIYLEISSLNFIYLFSFKRTIEDEFVWSPISEENYWTI